MEALGGGSNRTGVTPLTGVARVTDAQIRNAQNQNPVDRAFPQHPLFGERIIIRTTKKQWGYP